MMSAVLMHLFHFYELILDLYLPKFLQLFGRERWMRFLRMFQKVGRVYWCSEVILPRNVLSSLRASWASSLVGGLPCQR